MPVEYEVMRVRLTMQDEILGTKAMDPEVFARYIASLCKDNDLRQQEINTAERLAELRKQAQDAEVGGTSVFHRDDDGNVIIYDYQVRGFFKEAGKGFRERTPDTETTTKDGKKKKVPSKWKAPDRKIDTHVFVRPRNIILHSTTDEVAVCERPVRASTPQGPRVSLARSESMPAGTTLEFEILILKGSPFTKAMVIDCLDYGLFKGLGQWRNSGRGRFTWEEITEDAG